MQACNFCVTAFRDFTKTSSMLTVMHEALRLPLGASKWYSFFVFGFFDLIFSYKCIIHNGDISILQHSCGVWWHHQLHMKRQQQSC